MLCKWKVILLRLVWKQMFALISSCVREITNDVMLLNLHIGLQISLQRDQDLYNYTLQ